MNRMDARLNKVFPGTERYGLADWWRYIQCRIVGHRPEADEVGHIGCTRCHDTLLSMNPRQP